MTIPIRFKALRVNLFQPLAACLVTVVALLSGCQSNKPDDSFWVSRLRVESKAEPVVTDHPQPRFSWELRSDQRTIRQTYYQILVASSREGIEADSADVWDSGRIKSDVSIQVPYEGPALKSRTTYFWKVKVWCKGKGVSTSPYIGWHTGLLQEADWKANWIGMDSVFAWEDTSRFARLSARYLRRTFELNDIPEHARLYMIGLGLNELYINGLRIGGQVLSPTPTDFTQEVKYTTYELAPYLKTGTNVIGVVLGNGRFFNMRQHYKPWKIRTFGFPKLLLQLELETADGQIDWVLSDTTWRVTADGPIRSNNEWDGEDYDATKELTGWLTPGYDASAWLHAQPVSDPGANRRYFADSLPQKNEPKTPHGDLTLKQARRRAQLNDDMKVVSTRKPIAIINRRPDAFILDMGQNMTGWLRIQVRGERGRVVTLRFAESLNPDSTLYVANLRDAKATDTYTLKGGGEELWEPSFVYHGFRYVEVLNWPGEPHLYQFKGQVVSDGLIATGSFESSNQLLNQLYNNAWWGIVGNYKGMPVDCPQRNERQPWLGDRSTGCWGESYLFDNQRLYAKWLDDIQQAMSQEGQISDVSPNYYNYYTDNVTWPATYFLVAQMLYRQYGDQYAVSKHYPSMKKWMAYMEKRYLKNGLMTRDKYGDWCMPPESPTLIHAKDPARLTDGTLIATAYYIKLLQIMQEFATVLNRDSDRASFAKLADDMTTAFQATFYDKTAKHYGNNTVTANLLPLAFDITPEADRPAVFEAICRVIEVDNKGHIASGVIGTAWLMRTLSSQGRPDLAYRLATNTTYPSWGYMLKKGATTIWELWNGDTADPSMNSQNHVMLLGDLISWYYEHLAGIKSDPTTTAFKRIIMRPDFPAGLTFVKSHHYSSHGLIASEWVREGFRLTWQVVIPHNAEAHVYIPAPKEQIIEGTVKAEKAVGVTFLRTEGDRSVFRVKSGTYVFKVRQ